MNTHIFPSKMMQWNLWKPGYSQVLNTPDVNSHANASLNANANAHAETEAEADAGADIGELPDTSQSPRDRFNQDERFNIVFAKMDQEFNAHKDELRKIKTEKEFLRSDQIRLIITSLKDEIYSWSGQLQALDWLEEFFESVLVGYWRSIVTDRNPDVSMIDATDSVLKSEPLLEPGLVVKGKRESTPGHTVSNFSLPFILPSTETWFERINFVLICRNLDGTKFVDPDLEIAATSCLINDQAVSTYCHNYSWQIFTEKFERLLNEENVNEPMRISGGTIMYQHPDGSTRTIRNQENFAVALNYANIEPANRIIFTFVRRIEASLDAQTATAWSETMMKTPSRYLLGGAMTSSQIPVRKTQAGSELADVSTPSYKLGSNLRRPGVRNVPSTLAKTSSKMLVKGRPRTSRPGLDRTRGRVTKGG